MYRLFRFLAWPFPMRVTTHSRVKITKPPGSVLSQEDAVDDDRTIIKMMMIRATKTAMKMYNRV